MSVVAWIAGIVVAVGFGLAGLAKLSKQPAMQDASTHLGVPMDRMQMVGGAEVAGAVGVLLGVAVGSLKWLGVAAAVGLIIVGAGAVLVHQRRGDEFKDYAPAVLLTDAALLLVVALLLR
ncbi:MAG: DoxX family protein [Acidimicrobiales bacterium]|nr:DoxX family protein [Acidimicrobiales bacterium]